MSTVHVVQQGECLSSIAAQYGIPWKKIYNHPDNADFRRKRPDPNIICPGDQLQIPDLEQRKEEKSTDQKHVFVLERPKTTISIILQDEMGRPLANKKYIMQITGGSGPDVDVKGTTGSDGLVEQEIPADATDGELTVFASGGGYSWTLALGHLDPLEEISGLQHRLHNLGYDTDTATPGQFDDVTRDALKAFQFAVGLRVTGDFDDDSKKKLKELHD